MAARARPRRASPGAARPPGGCTQGCRAHSGTGTRAAAARTTGGTSTASRSAAARGRAASGRTLSLQLRDERLELLGRARPLIRCSSSLTSTLPPSSGRVQGSDGSLGASASVIDSSIARRSARALGGLLGEPGDGRPLEHVLFRQIDVERVVDPRRDLDRQERVAAEAEELRRGCRSAAGRAAPPHCSTQRALSRREAARRRRGPSAGSRRAPAGAALLLWRGPEVARRDHDLLGPGEREDLLDGLHPVLRGDAARRPSRRRGEGGAAVDALEDEAGSRRR